MTDTGLRPKLHPLLGTPLIVVAAVLASLLSAIPTVGIGALALSREGVEVSRATLEVWASRHFLLATVLSWLFVAPTLLFCGRWLAGLSRERMGLGRGEGATRMFVAGAFLGLATLILPALLGRALGLVVPAPTTGLDVPTGSAALVGVVFTIPALAVAAFGEELALRGVALRYWQPAAGGPGALIVSSLLFMVLHGMNPHASAFGWAGIFLAGLWLGIALMVTGSLWFATGLHLGWNVATALVLGLPVSGFTLPSLLRWETAESPLARRLFGGDFGPEEGLAYHVALTVSLLVVLVAGPALRARRAAASTGDPASPPSRPPPPGTPR